MHPLDFTHQARLRIPCLLVATYTRRQTDYWRRVWEGGRYPYGFPAAITGASAPTFHRSSLPGSIRARMSVLHWVYLDCILKGSPGGL